MKLGESEVRRILDEWVHRANSTNFIQDDPISIPHLFSDPLDIEVSGFFAAILSWGQRKTIVSKARELMARMDHAPGAFVRSAGPSDLKKMLGFKHRTFNDTDLLYLIDFFKRFYTEHDSLQMFFREGDVRLGLSKMHEFIFNVEHAPSRTRKHVSTPSRKSACKRLNMYLRWMVRNDEMGVDFGIWHTPASSALMIPLDVHVHRVALELGLMKRKIADWMAVEELTAKMREFDPEDPVKYDFALFYIGLSKAELT